MEGKKRKREKKRETRPRFVYKSSRTGTREPKLTVRLSTVVSWPARRSYTRFAGFFLRFIYKRINILAFGPLNGTSLSLSVHLDPPVMTRPS